MQYSANDNPDIMHHQLQLSNNANRESITAPTKTRIIHTLLNVPTTIHIQYNSHDNTDTLQYS
jgi:hypothetical protein